MKKAVLFLIGIALIQTIYTQNKNRIDWKTDLNYLAKELPEKHYNLFTVQNKEYFFSGLKSIQLEAEYLTDFQIALKIQQLIAKFGDSHTMLNFTSLIDKDQILPIHLFWTSDGLHILHTTPENEKLLGCQLLSINKVPITTVIDSLSTLFAIDNQSIVKHSIPRFIPYLQILECFGFTNEKQIELELKTNTSQTQTYLLKPSEMNRNNRISFKPDSIAFCVKNENVFFTDRYYPNEMTYYILYNKCWSKEIESEYGNKEKAEKMPSFKEFEKKIFNTLMNSSTDKIIFDLRYNGGGNSLQGTAFIEKLAEFLKKNPKIQPYVVLGRSTFSSAILNAMDFKRLTNAIFVGEETSGKPNHFGEVRNFQLPSSNLYVNYSTKYFKRTDEELSTITPDILIEMSFSDFTKGIDPVFEWIKNNKPAKE